jgi:LysM repeat protein
MIPIRIRSLAFAFSGAAVLSSCEVFKKDEPKAETYDAANAYNTATDNAANTGYPAANAYGNTGGYPAGNPSPQTNAYAQPGAGTQPYTQPPYTQPPTGAGYAGGYGAGAYQPPAAGTSTAGSGRVHSVVRGETLSGISRRYGVGVNALMQANNLTSPDLIREGQKLNIP